MAETTTATSLPASTSRLHMPRHVADAVEVGDRGSAEFHDETGHAVESPFSARRASRSESCANAGSVGGFAADSRLFIGFRAGGQQRAERRSGFAAGRRAPNQRGRPPRPPERGGRHAQGRGHRRKHPQGSRSTRSSRGALAEARRGQARLRDACGSTTCRSSTRTTRANPTPAVTRIKEQIAAADGVLFVTPEHNRSIPAALKNAIDWASRPSGKSAFKGKVGAIIGTSRGRSRPRSRRAICGPSPAAISTPCSARRRPMSSSRTG